MKSLRLLSLVPLLFTSCEVAHDWNELKSAPMTQADCYEGIVYIATHDRFAADLQNCDRGLGTWQSRWHLRELPIFGRARYRLRAEMMLDESSASEGWIIRYIVEQQYVDDPRRRRDPVEEDWEDYGQYRDREVLFADKLGRRLGVKT